MANFNKAVLRMAALSGLGALTGCVHEDKAPASSLEYLNGETYAATQPTFEGLPIAGGFERIDEETVITGTLQVGDAPALPPALRYAPLLLWRGKELMGQTTVDEKGAFELSARIPDGSYKLALNLPPWQVEQTIWVKGYRVREVRLVIPTRTAIENVTPGARP